MSETDGFNDDDETENENEISKKNVVTERSVDDDEEVACMVQSELNLGRYSVYVRTKKKDVSLRQRKMGEGVELEIEGRIRVSLPYPIDLQRITVTNADSTTLLLRLPLQRASLSKNDGVLIDYEAQREEKRSRVNLRELNKSIWKVLTVQCRRCGNVLVPPRLIRDVRRLPSPRWMELSGWCGGGIDENSSKTSTIMHARVGKCGVGRSRLLFHRSMIRPHSIVTVWQEKASKNKRKNPNDVLRCCGFTHRGVRGDVFCTRCKTIVGFAVGEDATKTSDTGGVSLYKFRLVASRRRGALESTSNLFCRYDVGSVVGPVLLESVRSRRRYRVAVVNASTKRCVLKMRVLSWSTEIYISSLWSKIPTLHETLNQTDSSTCPVIRVSYEFLEPQNDSSSVSSSSAQTLVFPYDICAQLITQLRNTTALLPQDQRECLGLSVGFVVW